MRKTVIPDLFRGSNPPLCTGNGEWMPGTSPGMTTAVVDG